MTAKDNADLKKIRLELARTPDHPLGSARHGYEFVAPLDGEDHIDAEVWKKVRDQCRVRRFWDDEADEIGHLRHTQGRNWAFHYDIKGDEDTDESGYRFGAHAFRMGEYVSIREQDGELMTFQVVSVRPVHP